MQYRIFKRNIYENRKTDWEDTGDVIEAERGRDAFAKWIAKRIYGPFAMGTEACTCEPRKVTYGENCCWIDARDLNAYPLSEEEYFTMELAVKAA